MSYEPRHRKSCQAAGSKPRRGPNRIVGRPTTTTTTNATAAVGTRLYFLTGMHKTHRMKLNIHTG